MAADPGVERVREFHEAFGLPAHDRPWMPDLSPGDRALLAAWAETLGREARILRQQAAEANGTGRGDLGAVLVRLQLHVEEVGEVAGALASGDQAAVLHELSDVDYVTNGTYLALGLGALKPAADAEVHRANMSKLGPGGVPIVDAAGRVVKGPAFQPADMRPLLSSCS